MNDDDRASLIETMVQSPVWTLIVLPALAERRSALMTELLNADDRFVEYQQGVKAIDNLLLFINDLEHPLEDSENG